MARVAGILSAQVGLLAKMLLLDQLQPRALGKQGNALYIIWYVPSSVLEGWSPPQQFSTKLCSVLLFLA